MSEQSRHFPQFYLTAPSPCPYLPDRVERKVFTHLAGSTAVPLNNALSLAGFRRSQNITYRPACQDCTACVSVRVLAGEFIAGRSFRRILRRNADLETREVEAVATTEQYEVFCDYIDQRHRSGGMADMTSFDYVQMIEESQVDSRIVEYRRKIPGPPQDRDGGQLLAAVLIDRLPDGLSMIYSFFRPQELARSLGTFMILDVLARARAMGRAHVYLGYWVKGSDKMDYKTRFLPQEQLLGQNWRRIDPAR
ncbi:Arginyl-tRNA--protein transferase [hydrothermal vent metagenome]|uniref:Arginyl-tRNA--protein transferase n=1 Tax=hydrothermal vent metagenome TaxID=652676 RepID=A0A3B0TDQ9_9ZZZZ